MATEGERIAVLQERVDQMWEWINGGPSTRYEDSARGRLHRIMTTLDTADKLAEALREVRRDKARQWSRWEKLGLFVFAGAAAVAPYVLLLVGH